MYCIFFLLVHSNHQSIDLDKIVSEGFLTHKSRLVDPLKGLLRPSRVLNLQCVSLPDLLRDFRDLIEAVIATSPISELFIVGDFNIHWTSPIN